MIKFLTKIKKCPNEIKNTLSQSLRYLSSKIIDEDEEILRKAWKSREKSTDFLADMSSPVEWYPLARKLKRDIIAHIGPTNSGKTYSALEALKKAKSGAYCGPLRLLAWEVHEKLVNANVKCSLITGQELEEIEGANHISCTVEMADTNKNIDVAVIDEYQLMGDLNRGWAFTQCILGMPAKTLYVCGSASAINLLKKLCHETGDNLKVVKFERLNPLHVERTGLGSVENIEAGDCLIAFSRSEIHGLKKEIEEFGKHACCVVYGALPPETRREQAKLFNDPNNSYTVLVASDAIGMGLNLDIRRIVFSTIEKFDGIESRFLKVSEVQQISGRAGRFGTQNDQGFVSSVHDTDLRFLNYTLNMETPQVNKAGLQPRFEQLVLFASMYPKKRLSEILNIFLNSVKLSSNYFLVDFSPMYQLAVLIHNLPLTLEEEYKFSTCPCDAGDPQMASDFLQYCHSYAFSGQVLLHTVPTLGAALAITRPTTEPELEKLEAAHKTLDIYLWLANRFQVNFPDVELANKQRKQCAKAIAFGLEKITADPDTVRSKMRKKSVKNSEIEGTRRRRSLENVWSMHELLKYRQNFWKNKGR